MRLIDTHCHLNHRTNVLPPAQLLQNMAAQQVVHCVSICTKHQEFPELQELAKAHATVSITYGIHPHESGQGLSIPQLEQALETYAHADGVVAFGEAGLDYYYDYAPRAEQRKSFACHLEAARVFGLPLVIHSREAEADTMELVDAALQHGPQLLILHCFTSSAKLADFAQERGIYLGCSGVVTFKRNQALRDIFQHYPEHLLVVETDAPFLAPEPHRGQVNQPAYVAHTAAYLAALRGVNTTDFAARLWENSLNLYPRLKPKLEAGTP